jgi:hypothetical protein
MYRLMKVYTGLTTVNVPVDANPERQPTSFVFDMPNLGTGQCKERSEGACPDSQLWWCSSWAVGPQVCSNGFFVRK